MPYLIAVIFIIVAVAALMVFRSPAEAPTTTPESVENTQTPANEPENFIEPTEPPPDTIGEEVSVPIAPPGEPVNISEPITDEPVAVPPVDSSPAEVGATGEFEAMASYSTGRAIHELDVTLTLENDIVTAADIMYDGIAEAQTPALKNFDAAYETEVIGKDIDEIQLSRVGGASWTSDAFNEAVADIRAQI